MVNIETIFYIALVLLVIAMFATWLVVRISEEKEIWQERMQQVKAWQKGQQRHIEIEDLKKPYVDPVHGEEKQGEKETQEGDAAYATFSQFEDVQTYKSYSEQYKEWMEEKKEPKPLPYKQRPLLTKTEFEFCRCLRAVCDGYGMYVCPKVRMEDFIEVTTRKERMKYRGYIKSRHIDFLVCDKKFRILCAIELDDSSHGREEAQKVDKLKNEIYQTIGLKLYRVKTTDNYREKIKELMHYCIPIVRSRYGYTKPQFVNKGQKAASS